MSANTLSDTLAGFCDHASLRSNAMMNLEVEKGAGTVVTAETVFIKYIMSS
jgi:hypothetical protein